MNILVGLKLDSNIRQNRWMRMNTILANFDRDLTLIIKGYERE